MEIQVVQINQKELEDCPIIGSGDEGVVYNYKNKCAIKQLTRYQKKENIQKLKRKLQKLSAMMKVKDPNCTIPIGFITTDGESIDGYYSKLVRYHKGRKDFEYLGKINNKNLILEYLIEGDYVLQRLHKKGFVLGDIKENNIMIDRDGNPIFIDTDNYGFQNYGYDFPPARAGILYSNYFGPISAQKDNDILVYSLMALKLYTKNKAFDCFNSREDMKYYGLRKLAEDKEIRDELEVILSDSTQKPYIGPILQKIKRNYK